MKPWVATWWLQLRDYGCRPLSSPLAGASVVSLGLNGCTQYAIEYVKLTPCTNVETTECRTHKEIYYSFDKSLIPHAIRHIFCDTWFDALEMRISTAWRAFNCSKRTEKREYSRIFIVLLTVQLEKQGTIKIPFHFRREIERERARRTRNSFHSHVPATLLSSCSSSFVEYFFSFLICSKYARNIQFEDWMIYSCQPVMWNVLNLNFSLCQLVRRDRQRSCVSEWDTDRRTTTATHFLLRISLLVV